MDILTIDTVTLCLWLLPWPVWLGWEIFLLVKRGQHVGVKTISMVARDRFWQLSSVVYLFAGMLGHWIIPGVDYAKTVPGVLFWLIAVGLLVWDVHLWSRPLWAWPKWQRWCRWPALWLVLGLLAGWLLFPQRGEVPWD